MQFGVFEFRPGWVPSLATLLLSVLFVGLGFWQNWRGDYKQGVVLAEQQRSMLPAIEINGAALDMNSMQYRQVSVTGNFDASHTLFIDNKIHQGMVGYQVVTPLQIANTNTYVMVNRGWVPLGMSRQHLPVIATPPIRLTIHGRLQLPTAGVSKLGLNRSNPGWPALVRWLDIPSITAETGLALKPYIILQAPSDTDGFVRDWPMLSDSPDRNYAYALQWFSFAVIVVFLWIKLNLRRSDRGKTHA
ncbi:MAG: SURF1 family protein [Gammaproteobacteria bacterium]|nr:SURF1 family protein [Gammaproteobacteria bacterium]